MTKAYDIIKRPIITEKSMSMTEDKRYTINMYGKEKRMGRFPAGRRASWKKAMVTLTADSKAIEFFEA